MALKPMLAKPSTIEKAIESAQQACRPQVKSGQIVVKQWKQHQRTIIETLRERLREAKHVATT